MSVVVGVISDTHGLLRTDALQALDGSSLIVHAGDVGDPAILDRLREIAPVVAVRGNVDTAPWARALPPVDVAEVAGRHLYVLHQLNQLDVDPAAGGFAAVIYGHSHKASVDTRSGVLYLNPGAAGPRRFALPVTVARLLVSATAIEPEIVMLST